MPTAQPPGAPPRTRRTPFIEPAAIVVTAAFVVVAVTQLATRMNHPAFSWPTMLWFFVVVPLLIVGTLAAAAWGVAYVLVPRASRLAFNATIVSCLLVLTGLRVAFMSGLLTGDLRGQPPIVAAPASPARTPAPARPQARPALARAPTSAPTPTPTPSAPALAANIPPPTPAPPPPQPTVDTAPLLDPFFAALDTECQGLVADAKAAYAAVTKPGQTPGELDAQVTSFRELEARSEALAKRLQGIVGDGIDALAPLKMSGVDAHRAVVARDESFNSFQRLSACGELTLFAKSAAALFTELKTCRAKVQVTSTGSITSSDRAVDRALFHKRAHVDMSRDRERDVLNRLSVGATK